MNWFWTAWLRAELTLSLVTWDAVRENRDPWQIMVTFVQGAEEKHASWSYDLHTNSVRALDEEARWLTENVASARPQVFDQDSKAPGANANPKAVMIEPIVVEDTSTEALVAELNAQRGQPQRMDLSEFADEDFTGSIPTVSDETGQIVPFGRSETDPQTHSALKLSLVQKLYARIEGDSLAFSTVN